MSVTSMKSGNCKAKIYLNGMGLWDIERVTQTYLAHLHRTYLLLVQAVRNAEVFCALAAVLPEVQNHPSCCLKHDIIEQRRIMDTQSNPQQNDSDCQIGPAKYLTAYFEGYFMCRIATDPDPTNETRGMSGYTMALSIECDLDQVIRLQVNDEQFLEKNLRHPAQEIGLDKKLKEGVQVRSVTFDGKPWHNEGVLKGAKVSLLDRDLPFKGPTFESRNNITGSDDTMSFVIDPFHLQISKDDRDRKIVIEAKDELNPAQPGQKIWEILDPNIYGRRLTSSVEENSKEVAQAINVFDLYGYFYDRRRFLRSEIDRLEKEKPEDYKTKIEQFKSRLYQLEFWGDRIVSKLGTKVSWSFEINGPKSLNENEQQKGKLRSLLKGDIDTGQPWPVQFWFGGWDGDLLVGGLS